MRWNVTTSGPIWQPLIKSEDFSILYNACTQLAYDLFSLFSATFPPQLLFLFSCLSGVLKLGPISPLVIHPLLLLSSAPITPPSHLLPSAPSPASSTLTLLSHFFLCLPLWNACCWSIRLATRVCSHSFLTVSKVSLGGGSGAGR